MQALGRGNRLDYVPDRFEPVPVDDLNRGSLAEVPDIEAGIHLRVPCRREAVVSADRVVAAGNRGVLSYEDCAGILHFSGEICRCPAQRR